MSITKVRKIQFKRNNVLINIETLEDIKTVAHEKEFNAWRAKLTPTEFNAIVDYMNDVIDAILDNGGKIINVTVVGIT